jgi:hypothetical protein
MEEYDTMKHFGEETFVDPSDTSKTWALHQVEWLIRKGEPIKPNIPIVKHLVFNIEPGATGRSRITEFVMSPVEPPYMPTSKRKGGVVKICDVKSDLSGVQESELEKKYKRAGRFRRGRKWFVCRFEVRVIVAPADLRFELWFKGQKFSGNHEPITVQWDEEGTQMRA